MVDEIQFSIEVPRVIPSVGQGYLTVSSPWHISLIKSIQTNNEAHSRTSYTAMLNTSLRGWRHAGSANGGEGPPRWNAARTRARHSSASRGRHRRCTRPHHANSRRWLRRAARHVITAHDNILEHLLSKCIPADHSVYITGDALAHTAMIYYLLAELCMPRSRETYIVCGQTLCTYHIHSIYLRFVCMYALIAYGYSCMARIPQRM